MAKLLLIRTNEGVFPKWYDQRDLKVIIKEDNYFEMIGQIDGLGLKKQIECPNQDFEYTKPWS